MIAVPPVKRYAQAASRHPDARRKSRSKGRFAARRNELKAASLGYEIDRRESWRGSTVLRRGADKIVVKRNGNGHYVLRGHPRSGQLGTPKIRPVKSIEGDRQTIADLSLSFPYCPHNVADRGQFAIAG
jgi:hypothetical protein